MRIPRIVCDLMHRFWPRNATYVYPTLDSGDPGDPFLPTVRHERGGGRRCGITYVEAQALIAAGVLTAAAKGERWIDVDLHEQTALSYFFAEVNEAWTSYLKKVEQARKIRDHKLQYKEWSDEQDREIARRTARMSRNVSHFMKPQ